MQKLHLIHDGRRFCGFISSHRRFRLVEWYLEDPWSVEQNVGTMPVTATAQFQNVFARYYAYVVIVALEPCIALLANPGHVVTAAACATLMGQDCLQCIVATVTRTDI